MGRASTKQAIVSFISTVEGVKTAYGHAPANIPDAVTPAVVVSLPDENESRVTMTAPVGRKKNEITVRLSVMDISPTTPVAEKKFDDLVDAIKAAIRERPTLDGAVLGAALRYMRTSVAEPRLVGKDNGNAFRLAVIEFDALEHVQG